MTQVERKINYSKDITYTTNSELGFDYLRDNMADNMVQCLPGRHKARTDLNYYAPIILW